MVLQTVGLDVSGDAVPGLGALRPARTSRKGVSETSSSVVHLVMRPQESAPETKLVDPADFIDQFVLLARVLSFIPDNLTLPLPAHLDDCRRVRNWEDC